MGRSHGGLTTKTHAVVECHGLPVGLALTPGRTHDERNAVILLNDLPENTVVLADKAYDAVWVRQHIEAQDAAPNIPVKVNRK